MTSDPFSCFLCLWFFQGPQWITHSRKSLLSVGSHCKAYWTFGRNPISDVTAGVLYCLPKPLLWHHWLRAWPQAQCRALKEMKKQWFNVEVKCGRQESLVVRNARRSCQFTVRLPEKNRQSTVGALNIRWNSIYFKSQGNQSLPRDEWLSSSQRLIWRDVASQERSQRCAVSNQHVPGMLCLTEADVSAPILTVTFFKTKGLWEFFQLSF